MAAALIQTPHMDLQRAPEVLPRVIPLAVFAAGKQRFEYVVRGFAGNREAKVLAFEHLPLEENGWDLAATTCRHIRTEPVGCVFLLDRG